MASTMWDVLGIPSNKVHVDRGLFVSYVVPPLVCYIFAAFVAVTSETRIPRLAMWPVVSFLAFRAVVSLEMAPGEPENKWKNMDLMIAMLFVAVNSLRWASEKGRLVRTVKHPPSLIADALDLAISFRGYGWTWSRGLYVPRETRPKSRLAFTAHVLVSGIFHCVLCGVLHLAVRTFTTGVGSDRPGASIFDETLPLPVRLVRSNAIVLLVAFEVYAVLQLTYDVFALQALVLFRADPALWPPAFDQPWYATSLNEFWSRRWHQWFRNMFLLGAAPFAALFGRPGSLVGAFVTSGFYHCLVMYTLDPNAEMWRMIVPFGMMSIGSLLERSFYRTTGRRVGGPIGWIWMFSWLLLWGNIMADGFTRAGMYVMLSPMDRLSPFRSLVEKTVLDIDAWLHTL